jgi:septal ring-binding cell division protein DamX
MPEEATPLGTQAVRHSALESDPIVSEHLLTQAIEGAEFGQPSLNPHAISSQAAHGESTIPVPGGPVSEPLPDSETMGMGLNDGDYTIQLMGSRSEESVIKFLTSANLPFQSGYFETRYQGEPWFVVVSGAFTSRSQASAGITRLPAGIREQQPWVRAASGINSSVRTLYVPN